MQNQLRMDVIGNKSIVKTREKDSYDKVLSVLLCLYCILMPFEEALASSFGSVLRLVALAVIGYSFIRCFNKHIKQKDLSYVLPFLIWIIFAVISVLWCKNFEWWKYFIKIYVFQLLFITSVIFNAKKINLDYCRYGLMLSALIASLILICFPSSSGYTDEGRRTIILLGNVFDPNIVASIIMLGAFSAFYYIFTLQKKHFIYKVICAILVIGILFTGSRGALISFVCGFLIVELYEIKKGGKSRKNAILLLGCAVIVCFAVYNFLPEKLLKSRFSKDTILGLNEYNNGSHNRYTIWQNALIVFKEKPIFGWGCGNFFNAIATVYKECASHNLYILLLVEYGVIGFAIFIYGLIHVLNCLRKSKMWVQLSMQISVCIMALTLDSITYKYFWVCVMFSIVTIVRIKCNEEKNKADTI